MKKAGKFFSDMVSKSKQMFNQPKNMLSPSSKGKNAAENSGFDSGEDDDLIEIGKHKGAAGTKSLFRDLESLTGTQILQEEKYALEFK